MLYLALNTYAHLFFIITIICCLLLELKMVKGVMSFREISKLNKLDGLYGLAAILVVITGLLNWFSLAKGYEYYASNTIFLIKITLFIIVGVLSIYPTVMFFRLKRRNKHDKPDSIVFDQARNVKRVIRVEIAIMFFIPLLAELMANGIDL